MALCLGWKANTEVNDMIETKDTKISENMTLQFSAEYDSKGNRLCTCGSGVPWQDCRDNRGFCG